MQFIYYSDLESKTQWQMQNFVDFDFHWHLGVCDAAVLRHGDDLYASEYYDYEDDLDPKVWLHYDPLNEGE